MFNLFNFLKKSKSDGSPEKFKTYATEKYEFEYPSGWSIKETDSEDKTFVQLDLKQNSAKEKEIGKWLRIKVYFGPEFPPQKTYLKDMVSGQLVVAGKKYDRVDLGSGLFLYNVVVEENDFMFDFSYNSSSTENIDTRVIEAIIQSLKFK